ncbi:hypothetical protein SADUNF_Sadunf07G0004400 [Salix dunnii]|uniref:Uncharacterized protein n=1 Tax=Salix dunnii TaxID=1413687 RepID=A0A835JYV9_9ROSI|nr:hypothetical protein SADUNF_Sadunf07G0004400 [Salix dunnii]
MGNCQAAEAATVVIQHPGNKIERIYWSVSAHEIMNSNPGHYVALVVTSPTTRTENGLPLKQLKLLRPDDTLLMDVLKEFAAKKCVKLGKLLKESRGLGVEMNRKNSSDWLNPISTSDNSNSIKAFSRAHKVKQGEFFPWLPCRILVNKFVCFKSVVEDYQQRQLASLSLVMESFQYLSISQGTKLVCTHKSKDARFVFQYYKTLDNECILRKKKKRSRTKVEQEINRLGSNGGSTSNSSSRGGVGMHPGGGGQWKPALQSISETGT